MLSGISLNMAETTRLMGESETRKPRQFSSTKF